MTTNDPLSEHLALDQLLLEVEKRIEGVLQHSSSFYLPDLVDARTASAYHFSVCGKRLRARLAIKAGISLGLSDNDMVCVASAVELLHNASLIHDDIQDRDQYRRQQPSVWKKFDKNIAICSGDLLLSAAFCAVAGISQPEKLPAVLALIHERTTTTICGQCADLAWAADAPHDLDRYIKIAGAKSGALLSLPLELVLSISAYPTACGLARLACEHFSISYQIADDLDDLDEFTHQAACQDTPQGMNILFFLHTDNTRLAAINQAIDLACQHLQCCKAAAAQLPLNTGAALLALAAGLQQSLEAKLLKVPN